MLKKTLLLSLFLLEIAAGCKKESPASTIGVPNESFYFSDDIYKGNYPNLVYSGGWRYLTGGYDGLIVLCNSSTPTYLAFDRGCPYDCQTNTKAIVTVQTGGIMVVCPVCGTQYSLYSGTVTKGPGTQALKQYYTSFSDPNLTVSSSSPL